MSKINRREQGRVGEDMAAEYLQKCGLRIIERNYRFERGEIDIIAEEGDDLVFVEVKARRNDEFGSPEEAVSEEKQEKIYKIADGYLFERNLDDRPCRFDVVAIEFRNGRSEIRHIRNAF